MAAAKEGSRIFVGGLSPEVTERDLQRTFSRFGDILDCQVLLIILIYFYHLVPALVCCVSLKRIGILKP